MRRRSALATCLGDLVFPEAVADADVLLREAASRLRCRDEQVCCGQPAFNSGHRKAARRVARGFVKAFSRSLPVVIPSGSCATMVAHYLPDLVGEEPYDGLGALGVSRSPWAQPPAQRGTHRRLSRLLSHAARAQDRGTAPPPARAIRRERGDAAAAGSLLRFRRHVLRASARGSVAMADDKSASGRVGAEALVTADRLSRIHLRGAPKGGRAACRPPRDGAGSQACIRRAYGVSAGGSPPELVSQGALPRNRSREARGRVASGADRQLDRAAARAASRGVGQSSRGSRSAAARCDVA